MKISCSTTMPFFIAALEENVSLRKICILDFSCCSHMVSSSWLSDSLYFLQSGFHCEGYLFLAKILYGRYCVLPTVSYQEACRTWESHCLQCQVWSLASVDSKISPSKCVFPFALSNMWSYFVYWSWKAYLLWKVTKVVIKNTEFTLSDYHFDSGVWQTT